MEKSRDAFRTISEVAELLDTPAHVLRFWESRFPQIRPVKRAGGRRYYRPSDVALLSGIKRLLHGDGLTIRGAQKVLRENGIRHVMSLADGPFAQDALEETLDKAGDEVGDGDGAPPEAEVLAFPDPAAGRRPPAPEALPLWSTAPPAGTEDALPDAADRVPAPDLAPEPAPAPERDEALPLRQAQPAGSTGPAPPPGPAARTVAPLRAAPQDDPADANADRDDPGLAGVIAARLRALDGAERPGNRAALVAAALRLRDLQARLAAAAGVGGP
jgi:DNA-binding transcriptional MerR regulator